MRRREYLLATAGIAASTSIGAVAYTTASADRDVTIEIAADDQALIGLSPGPTNAVEITDSVLTIDTATGDSDGLNPDGNFVYGDGSTPTTEYAFSLTNNDSEQRTFTLGLEDFTFGGDAQLTISLYEDDGTLVGDITPADDQSVTLDAATTAYAVLDVTTDGLTDGDTMNGTLTVNAE